MKTIFQNPVKYGYHLRYKDLYPLVPTNIITIDSTILNLPQFALNNNINFRILKDLNPWLLKYTLTNKEKKKYDIKIPVNACVNNDSLFRYVKEPNSLFNDTLKVEKIE